jgi:outer membrane lipoprotein-sorting protein
MRHLIARFVASCRRLGPVVGLALALGLILPLADVMPPARAQSAYQGGTAASGLSAEDQADVARAQAYLNSVHSLKARFLQIAPNGGQSEGTAWLERPGRMRFQYDPPAPYLLVAGHGLLVFYDASLKQTSNIPLGSTPVSILLAPEINLSGGITVTNVEHPPGGLLITLIRTASPGDGSITLSFATDPMQLRGWTVIDAQRRETRIELYNEQLGGTFQQSLFTFIDPNFYNPPRGSGG